MAGILLLTGSAGTEGTLGGLVEEGRRSRHHLRRAPEESSSSFVPDERRRPFVPDDDAQFQPVRLSFDSGP